MIEHGLLDELRPWVHPLIIGGTDRTDFVVPHAAASLLHLREATTLAHGILLLAYDFPAAADRQRSSSMTAPTYAARQRCGREE